MSKNICCMNEMYTFDSIMKTREQHAMHVLYGAEVKRIRDLTIGETGPRGYIYIFLISWRKQQNGSGYPPFSHLPSFSTRKSLLFFHLSEEKILCKKLFHAASS